MIPMSLEEASETGDVDGVRRLLARQLGRPLVLAARNGHLACVDTLLIAGADTEAVFEGIRPLHWAAARGEARCLGSRGLLRQTAAEGRIRVHRRAAGTQATRSSLAASARRAPTSRPRPTAAGRCIWPPGRATRGPAFGEPEP